jgi:lipid-A-disaccharide synthase
METNLAILSGEPSGDLVGAALARELAAMAPTVALWGLGSRRMREAGVELLCDSGDWGAIGVIQALRVYPRVRYTTYPRVLREIERRRPAAVILIDFGAFNVRVARWCKPRGFRIFYYFPPGSWRRDGRHGAELAELTDRVATPFPWSAERLCALGVNAEFVGHPLLDLARPALSRDAFLTSLGLDELRPIVGLLPGSRSHEILHNLPVLFEAAARIAREAEGAQFVVALASPAARAMAERELTDFIARVRARSSTTAHAPAERGGAKPERALITPEGLRITPEQAGEWTVSRRLPFASSAEAGIPPVVLVEGHTYDVIAHSDALMVCSGTATLEAAVLGTPMVILYRGSTLMNVERRLRRIRPEHIGMPNIIARRRIVPELIQEEADPDTLAALTLRYLRDPEYTAAVRSELAAVRAQLGEPGASARAARMALQTAGIEPTARA